ncbi:MAG: YncE family protein [Candidatus Korobacteraceae bacterium]
MKVSRGTVFLLLAALILLAELGCGDQYRPVANPIVGPGGQPQNTHFAYVVNNNPNGNGSTTTIDVSGDTVSWLQPMGVGSIYEALPSSSTALFIANSGSDTVSDFPAYSSGAVTTIGLLSGSHPLFLTMSTNTTVYALNSGFNSACTTTGSVSSIATITATVTNTACVGLNPINMVQAASGGQVFVLNQGDNLGQGSVSVLDPATLALVKTLNPADGLGLNPVYATSSVDGSYIFVVTQGDGVHPGALDILTPGLTPAVAASVPLGVKPTYSYLDAHLNRLYVINAGDNTVSVLDASNVNVANSPPIPSLSAPVAVGTTPSGIAALQDGTRFYVANSGSNDVSVVSATSFAVLKTVAVGVGPTFVAADPGSTKVYVTNPRGFSTSVIQTVNDTVSATIAAPPQDPTCTASCALQQPMMVVTQ